MTHRAFCGALVEETGRVLAVPAPSSPRPPDLEAENVGKDKEKGEEEEENSAVAETEQPLCVEAVTEKPQRIPSPPPLPQEPQQSPSPLPLPQEPQPLHSRPPLPQEPQPLCSRPPFLPQHQQPVVAVLAKVDGMLLLYLVYVLILLPIDRLDEIYCKFLLL